MPEHAIALDLGGTDLKSARVGPDGRLAQFSRRPSRAAESPEALLATLVATCEPHRAGAIALGVGYPGVVDPARGELVARAVHAQLPAGFPLRVHLERELGLPVCVENDANAAAYAEHIAGAARGCRVSLTVTIGTGVGCGIVIDGRLLRGAWGGAGEIAHMGLNASGPPCACGVEGCAEPLAGGAGLTAGALAAGLHAADAEAVFAAAAAGDARAGIRIAGMAEALGRQIAAAVQVVNPEIVVIGGGVAAAGEALLGPLRAAVARFAQPSHTRRLRIVPAVLGNRAGTVGAGLLAWERAASQ